MTVISYNLVHFSVVTLHLPSLLQYFSLSHPSLVCKQLSRGKVRLKRLNWRGITSRTCNCWFAHVKISCLLMGRNKPDPAGIKTLYKVDRFLNSPACTLLVRHSFLRLFPMLLSYCIEGTYFACFSISFVCLFFFFLSLFFSFLY